MSILPRPIIKKLKIFQKKVNIIGNVANISGGGIFLEDTSCEWCSDSTTCTNSGNEGRTLFFFSQNSLFFGQNMVFFGQNMVCFLTKNVFFFFFPSKYAVFFSCFWGSLFLCFCCFHKKKKKNNSHPPPRSALLSRIVEL